MTNDLVAELREAATSGKGNYGHRLVCAKAADEIDELGQELRASRTLLEEWMLASHDFDMDAWVKRVRNMLEDSNPFNRHRTALRVSEKNHGD